MYLSHLMIDVGDNPDRPRPGRLWLRNIYHVHQRLSMAFPSPRQREEDPHFLRPFDPAGFERSRLLFRVDNSIEDDCSRAIILVQSDMKPDWGYAFQNARMFLAAEPEVREYHPTFQPGEAFRFRIRVNLSKKSSQHRKQTPDKIDAEGRPASQGKRVALTWDKDQRPDEVIEEWFAKKGRIIPSGQKDRVQAFTLHEFHVLHLGWVIGYRSTANAQRKENKDGHSRRQMKFRSALLEGSLEVNDAPAFAQSVASGIGSAKAFGFGLLTVIPA